MFLMNKMIFGFLLFLVLFSFLTSESYYPSKIHIIRNMGLRFLLTCNYKKHKQAVQTLKNISEEKIIRLYEKSILKYSELMNDYYSLNEDERLIIETMIEMIL